MFLFFPSLVVSENSFPFPCQVLGETIHITTEYLTNKEKVIMAGSNVEALEAKSSRLRKDLIAIMDGGNKIRERIKALSNDL